MAQSIRNLSVGSKIKDSKGNIFTVIAHNHYEANETVLMATKSATSIKMHTNVANGNKYENSEVDYYLKNNYSRTLDSALVSAIKETPIQVLDKISNVQSSVVTVKRKYFTLSACEMDYAGALDTDYSLGNKIKYFNDITKRIVNDVAYWTRMQSKDSNNYWIIEKDGYIANRLYNESFGVVPAFTVGSVLVSDNVSNGCYDFIFNEPPVIQTINNINGNYGSTTNISYIATDNDDTELTHYISFDNGTKWQEIKPTRNGNIYTYSHVFSELNTYYCRIKVVDGANNETVSNAFTITVNAVAPTVNIVSVVDKVVTFKANCITSEISKVEILINGQNAKTFTSGFDFNLVYEIDRSKLNVGKNSIQIKATSQENLVGYANLEASKTKYNLPPIGTKVIIGGIEYSISNASEDGSNQTYTLNNNLINQVKKGDTVQVTQDLVKVLCSMSTLENVKDYKEMKLVKTKKLKGDLEGYVEEKYELQGEGRYSTIKLEMQRFNNNVSTEVLELQQYFDYLEDVNIEFGGFEDNDSNGGSDGGSSENIPVTDINCSEWDVTMEVGQTKQIIGNIVPSNATNKLIHWNSNNPSVATVNSSGLIDAKGVGYSLVTATTDDGGYRCDIHVNVSEKTSDNGSTTSEYEMSCTSEYILDKMYPMGQSHEAIPNGNITVPDGQVNWKYRSRWENQDRPYAMSHSCGQSGCPGTGAFQALGCWSNIYRVEGTPFSQNTGVEMKDIKVYGWYNGKWELVQHLPIPNGNFYPESFGGDVNKYFGDSVKQSSTSKTIILREANKINSENCMYHPFSEVKNFDTKYEYIYTCIDLRKVKWDENGIDDRDQTHYCSNCGGDWWLAEGLMFHDSWQHNKGVCQPKMIEITKEWRRFSMTTVPQGWSNGFPK